MDENDENDEMRTRPSAWRASLQFRRHSHHVAMWRLRLAQSKSRDFCCFKPALDHVRPCCGVTVKMFEVASMTGILLVCKPCRKASLAIRMDGYDM